MGNIFDWNNWKLNLSRFLFFLLYLKEGFCLNNNNKYLSSADKINFIHIFGFVVEESQCQNFQLPTLKHLSKHQKSVVLTFCIPVGRIIQHEKSWFSLSLLSRFESDKVAKCSKKWSINLGKKNPVLLCLVAHQW